MAWSPDMESCDFTKSCSLGSTPSCILHLLSLYVGFFLRLKKSGSARQHKQFQGAPSSVALGGCCEVIIYATSPQNMGFLKEQLHDSSARVGLKTRKKRSSGAALASHEAAATNAKEKGGRGPATSTDPGYKPKSHSKITYTRHRSADNCRHSKVTQIALDSCNRGERRSYDSKDIAEPSDKLRTDFLPSAPMWTKRTRQTCTGIGD